MPFHIPIRNIWETRFLCTLTSTWYYQYLSLPILVGVKWYLLVVLLCISLMANDVEHLFMCIFAICDISEMSIPVLCPFSKWTGLNFKQG